MESVIHFVAAYILPSVGVFGVVYAVVGPFLTYRNYLRQRRRQQHARRKYLFDGLARECDAGTAICVGAIGVFGTYSGMSDIALLFLMPILILRLASQWLVRAAKEGA